MEHYNNNRPHESLGNLSPMQYLLKKENSLATVRLYRVADNNKNLANCEVLQGYKAVILQNLPSYIKFNNFVQRVGGDIYRNMTYSYRADGVKIKKIHHYFSGKSRADAFATTDYIDGFQYNNEQFGLTGKSILKFFPTSEGYFDFVNNR